MIPVSLIHGARSEAREGRAEARSDVQASGYPAVLYKGVVQAVQSGETYQVGVLDDGGEVVESLDHLRAWPVDAGLEVGDGVWVVHREGVPVPEILVSGGRASTDVGVLLD